MRSLKHSGKRNRITALAIALTALLFTAVFTGILSLIKSDMAFRESMHWASAEAALMQNISLETIFGIAALLAVILITGYLIIYSIFQISVSQDIRYYGLLKTIGVTQRQLKRVIRLQAVRMWLVGTPVGLILGFILGALISPVMIQSINQNITTREVSFSPLIFLLAALFTLITVLISCLSPARKAASVSPVEAVRYTEGETKKSSRRTHRGGPVQMAAANLSRSRGKTAVVLISLSLAVVLLNLLFIWVTSFDDARYIKDTCAADFVIGDAAYFTGDAENAQSLSDSLVEGIEGDVKMASSGSAYILPSDCQAFSWMDEDARDALYDSFGATDDELEEADTHSPKENGRIGNEALIEAFDDDVFQKLTVIKGDLGPVLQPNSHAVALVVQTDDDGVPLDLDTVPAIGSTLDVTYARYTGDGEVPYDVKGGRNVSYQVAAYVSIPSQLGLRYEEAAYQLVMPTDTFMEDSVEKPSRLFYMFDAADRKDQTKAEGLLKSLVQKNSSLSYESKTTILAQFAAYRNMYAFIGGLLCLVVAAIGILNFFNVIMTGILSRKREFAILEAVGMTRKQLRHMLVMEGTFYTAGAGIISAVLSIVLYPFAIGALTRLFWFSSPHFSFRPVFLAIPVYILMGWLIPQAVYGSSVKESIVDRIRELE